MGGQNGMLLIPLFRPTSRGASPFIQSVVCGPGGGGLQPMLFEATAEVCKDRRACQGPVGGDVPRGQGRQQRPGVGVDVIQGRRSSDTLVR